MGIANPVAILKPSENSKLETQIQPPFLSPSHARTMSAMCPYLD